MLTRTRNPRSQKHRHTRTRANPLYGYGYRPDFPSILSVAHDEQNGGRVFIITDRPCMIADSYPGDAPLELPGFPAVLLTQERLTPTKFALVYNMAIPRGFPWRWPENRMQIWSVAGGHPLNAGAGTIDDFPGPYVPIPTANVVYASAMGWSCQITFDRRVALIPGVPIDDAFTFNGFAPSAVSQLENVTLQFDLGTPVDVGMPWQVNYQPGWLFTPVTVPQEGRF